MASSSDDWEGPLAEINKRWDEAMKVCGEDTLEKRKIYSDLELLRLEYVTTTTPAEVITEFNKARYRMSIPTKRNNTIGMYLRILSALLFVIAAAPWLVITLPLRLLHPLLRRLGVTNNNLPLDLAQRYFAAGLMAYSGVEVKWQGLKHIDVNSNTLGMFSHVSNLDAFCIATGPISFKWVGKKSAFFIPIIGWCAYAWGHVPIERGNLEKARASLKYAASYIREYGRSLGISPEGTRSRSGRLLEFKKGPFHLALELNIPITMMLVENAFQLWPPGQLFTSPGTVVVRVLPQISVIPGETVESLSKRVKQMFLVASAEECQEVPQCQTSWVVELLRVPLAYLLLWVLIKIFCG